MLVCTKKNLERYVKDILFFWGASKYTFMKKNCSTKWACARVHKHGPKILVALSGHKACGISVGKRWFNPFLRRHPLFCMRILKISLQCEWMALYRKRDAIFFMLWTWTKKIVSLTEYSVLMKRITAVQRCEEELINGVPTGSVWSCHRSGLILTDVFTEWFDNLVLLCLAFGSWSCGADCVGHYSHTRNICGGQSQEREYCEY